MMPLITDPEGLTLPPPQRAQIRTEPIASIDKGDDLVLRVTRVWADDLEFVAFQDYVPSLERFVAGAVLLTPEQASKLGDVLR